MGQAIDESHARFQNSGPNGCDNLALQTAAIFTTCYSTVLHNLHRAQRRTFVCTVFCQHVGGTVGGKSGPGSSTSSPFLQVLQAWGQFMAASHYLPIS